jgi:hypothetical protein
MTQEVTPPRYSTRDATDCRSAQLIPFPPRHKQTKRPSPAQKLGLRYEVKAFKHLSMELDSAVFFHPAFRFNAGKPFDEHAIPDAIYLHEGILTIFEIKLKHTADAWYQLRKLYLPVVQKAYPGAEINLCEICREYDPSIRLAGDVTFVENLNHFVARRSPAFGIYIWSGRT